MKRLTLTIHGLVQGVGYRYMARNEGRRRGLTGYVRNLDDGSLELLAEGEQKDLKNFMDWCYNGVNLAQVTKIEPNWSEPTGEFSDFVIRF